MLGSQEVTAGLARTSMAMTHIGRDNGLFLRDALK